MNMNTSLYANGVGGMSEHFGISEQAARVGQVRLDRDVCSIIISRLTTFYIDVAL